MQCRPRGAVHLDPRAETSLKRGADSNPPPPGLALNYPAGNYLVVGRSLLSTGVRKHAKLRSMFLPNLVLQNQTETIVLTSDVSKMGPPSKALAPSASCHTRSRQESRKLGVQRACSLSQFLSRCKSLPSVHFPLRVSPRERAGAGGPEALHCRSKVRLRQTQG